MGIKRKIEKNYEKEIMPIGAAFEEFIVEKEATNLSPKTISNYKQSYGYFVQFNDIDADMGLDEISQKHIFHWVNTMRQEDVKPSSINHYLRDVRAFLYWCMSEDRKYIETPFKIQNVEGQEEQPKHFEDEELELLLEKPRRTDDFSVWRAWAIVNWVLGTGNRAATVVDVRIDDVDFKKKEITLHHTKNKKAQIIPLSSSLLTVLKEYLRTWKASLIDSEDAEGWLFPNYGLEQLTTNALRHGFAKYCKDRGVEKTNIHGLRHNFAKGWIQNNGDMVRLQKILGHSTLEMTRKYVRLYSEDLKDGFDKFNPLDTIKKKQSRKKLVSRD